MSRKKTAPLIIALAALLCMPVFSAYSPLRRSLRSAS